MLRPRYHTERPHSRYAIFDGNRCYKSRVTPRRNIWNASAVAQRREARIVLRNPCKQPWVLNSTRYHHSSRVVMSVTATRVSRHLPTRATSHCVDDDHAKRHIDNARVVLTFGNDNVSKRSLPTKNGRTRASVQEMGNAHCYHLRTRMTHGYARCHAAL